MKLEEYLEELKHQSNKEIITHNKDGSSTHTPNPNYELSAEEKYDKDRILNGLYPNKLGFFPLQEVLVVDKNYPTNHSKHDIKEFKRERLQYSVCEMDTWSFDDYIACVLYNAIIKSNIYRYQFYVDNVVEQFEAKALFWLKYLRMFIDNSMSYLKFQELGKLPPIGDVVLDIIEHLRDLSNKRVVAVDELRFVSPKEFSKDKTLHYFMLEVSPRYVVRSLKRDFDDSRYRYGISEYDTENLNKWFAGVLEYGLSRFRLDDIRDDDDFFKGLIVLENEATLIRMGMSEEYSKASQVWLKDNFAKLWW
ncbi:MAG: hypothetical protein QM571_02370 [Micrococcaceae bacterium]